MNKKISFLVTIGLCVIKFGNAQEQHFEPNQFGDTFQANIIDQMERDKEKTYQFLDSIKQISGGAVVFNEEDANIAQRIQKIQKTVPLEYNARVKAYLDKYISKNYKPYMEKLLGLSEYYFPIYDQIFSEQGIPEEVKYLSVIESSLNPHTVSTSGAVGPWQFVYGTAKFYNMTMDSNFDERKDVYTTTNAVSSYLKDAYDEFNDWLLALASYNCGRGCVRRAIIRSGLNSPNYWELSPFLPKETQNYIPKFIAMTYVLNHAELYGLNATENELRTEHKVLMLDKSINLGQVASALTCSPELLKQLNPGYKKDIVVASPQKQRRLVIPISEAMSDSLIYAALNNTNNQAIQNAIAAVEVKEDKSHTVVKGETLQSISKKYNVSIPNLLAWNNLTSRSSISGKTLVVARAIDEELTKNVVAASKVKSARTSNNPTFVSYVVKKGDTLSGIADKHRGATVSKIKSDNNLRGSNLKIGQKLKIYKGKS